MRNNNTLIWTSALLSVLILAIFWMDSSGILSKGGQVVTTDTVFQTRTDTIWRDTTIVEREIVPKIIVKNKVDTVFNSLGDTIELVSESKMYEKSLVSGKDTADVEIYVSGIETSLDSLRMHLRTHSEVITNTTEITNTIVKRKRIHFSPQVGLGYGILNNKADVFIGFGVSVDL